MSVTLSPGAKFRLALENNKPLQVVGTINAYCAMMAEQLGHQAIYLSGGGVANASYGLPDLGMTSLVGGKSVSKSDSRICAYGKIDELNSYIGACKQYLTKSDDSKDTEKLIKVLYRIQNELFNVLRRKGTKNNGVLYPCFF